MWACLVLHSGLAEYFAGGRSIELYAIAGSRTFYRLGFKIDTYMNFWYKQLRIGIHKGLNERKKGGWTPTNGM